MRLQDDIVQVKTFAVQRLRHWSQIYLSGIAPMMHRSSEVEIAQYLDQCMERVVRVMADTCKGETTTESKTISYEFEFDVFATWWDHLKYDLRERRFMEWIPTRFTKSLKVKYQKVVKSKTVDYPVAITRSCPHAMVDFNGRPEAHVRFLFPNDPCWGDPK